MPDETVFATKTTSIAPLTDRADAFSARTYARPDMRRGRTVVANYEFPESTAIPPLGVSYSRAGQQQGEPPGASQ